MDEYKTDKTAFRAEDFQDWQARGGLELTPKFQRRPVWRNPAKSFFIDTLLRGMTVPPIYLRLVQNDANTKTIREVVDGQQRISTVLGYMEEDGYKLADNLNAPWAGKRFSELSVADKNKITNFSFSCEIFKGISDRQVLEVFCRLNMNGVPLNSQELRNGKYFGKFKQTSYKLALESLQFWRDHKIFTELGIARMLEVELTSELLIAGNAGMQDKKKSIESFYAEWEGKYPNQSQDEKRFFEVMDAISETFANDTLASTEFRRPPMFYTLYCVIYHRMFKLEGIQRNSPRKRLTSDDRQSLHDAVFFLSDIIAQSKDETQETPDKYKAFLLASARQTDNIKPRTSRFNTLYETAF